LLNADTLTEVEVVAQNK